MPAPCSSGLAPRTDLQSTQPLLYTKRAAAYISLRSLTQALRDLNKAVELDDAFVQVGACRTGKGRAGWTQRTPSEANGVWRGRGSELNQGGGEEADGSWGFALVAV